MTQVERTVASSWVVLAQVTATHTVAWNVHAAIEGVLMVAGTTGAGVRVLGAIWARAP